MSLLSLTILITSLGLVMTSEESKDAAAPARLSRYGYSCNVGNRVYKHGQVFTIGRSRCIKYRCYHGSYDFYEEGCDQWGRCWPANQALDYRCRRYTCHVAHVGGGFKSYAIRPLSAQNCQDRFHQCRRPGELFEYVLDGHVKRQCSCRPGGASITYYCYD